ncbi:Protein kinase superfamily protein [Euphorbia peplus]|nr:Protein kinase superfamily protein [Euphorbia peplus]
MENQRVVVIQDASGGIISWVLQSLSLKPGDSLTVVALVHFGYKNKVDSNSIIAKKKEEYGKNSELIQIAKLYQMEEVEFRIEVLAAGASPKVAAVKEAENLKATWLILDRKMKKHRKYFLDKLSCEISRMKSNKKILQLRGPKTHQQTLTNLVTYDDMMPGIPEDLFSIEFNPVPGIKEADQLSHSIEEIKEDQGILFQTSMCSLCNNRRPDFGLQIDFTYTQLHSATDGFSPTNSLSEVGIPSTFRGQLKPNNLKIIVKNLNPQGEINIESQIEMLKKARHDNVLMLLGSCTQESLKLLVYEYACNGSVNQHLSKHCPLPLTWSERVKVALGAARGLNYLHEHDIVHRNVRSSNILLTHDFEPKLGDFGIQSEHNVLETLEYLAPEYAGNWKLSTMTDVYAFGIFLLELITGRKVTDKMPGGKSLTGWARPLVQDRRHAEIIDTRIVNSHDSEQLYWMCRVIQKCLQRVPQKRLTMDKVVSALECIEDRGSQFDVSEDISAVRLFLARTSSELSGIQRNEKKFERESFCRDVDVLSNSFSVSSSSSATNSTRTSTSFRTFSLTSSSASTSTRTSTSFSRSSISSGMSVTKHKNLLGKLENRVSLSYAEMLT